MRLHKHQAIISATLILTFSRLIINMARRFPYAFLPAISRQLGVPLTSVQNVMALQAGIGVVSPVFGPVVERYGRKRALLVALALMIAGSALGAFVAEFVIFAVVMILLGLAKIIFDPSLLAYLGDRVPYHRRGLILGFTELSWAGSLLVAAPVVGIIFSLFAVDRVAEAMLVTSPFDAFADSAGLQVVFGGLAVLSFSALVLIWLFLPSDRAAENGIRPITPWDAWRIMRHSPAALAAMGYAFGISAANEVFFINYGIWMEASFGLLLAALGAVTTVISLAEIGGEVTVITIADRLGKRRLALLGCGVASIAYLVLPNLSFSLGAALVGLFVMFLFVEIGIVAALPLFTEVLPKNRAVMMSGVAGAAAFGRLSGALLGGVLFATTGDFVLIGLVSMVIGLTAWFLLWRFVHEE